MSPEYYQLTLLKCGLRNFVKDQSNYFNGGGEGMEDESSKPVGAGPVDSNKDNKSADTAYG
jgi:hypothetical protein